MLLFAALFDTCEILDANAGLESFDGICGNMHGYCEI